MGVFAAVFVAACGDSAPASDTRDGASDAAGDAPADVSVVDSDTSIDSALPFVGTVRGIVVDTSAGQPIADAIVRFGGHSEIVKSQSDGRFTLVVAAPGVRLDQLALTAGKARYFSAGVEVKDPSAEQRIELRALTQTDNPAYDYIEPGSLTNPVDPTPLCRHCHENQLRPFETSAHASAAKNPRLHDIYNGTASGITSEAACLAAGGSWRDGKAPGSSATVAKKCYVALGGVLSHLNSDCGDAAQQTCDDPRRSAQNLTGPCADCHAPGSKGHVAGKTDLNRVDAAAHANGIHCDFCHKIANVTVNDSPGVDGAITLLRPSSMKSGGGFSVNEVFFGPLTDVTTAIMGNVYQPQFDNAEFCSACHQWLSKGIRPADVANIDASKWPDGLPLQDTYYEWSKSAKAGITPCQRCHMPARPYENATIDFKGEVPWTSNVLGWPRAFGEVHEHSFAPRLPALASGETVAPGEPPRDLLRAPIAITITPTRTASELRVDIALTNSGAGHSLPTGTPSRQLLLLVSADVGGTPLRASGGYSVPAWIGAALQSELGAGKATLAGDKLTLPTGLSWPANAAQQVVRFVAPTTRFADYPATRWFDGKTAQEKNMPVLEPRDEARIVSVAGQSATLDHAPPAAASADGTRVLVGDALPDLARKVDDTFAVSALGGCAGWAFGKLMRASDGRVGVPFFMASDIASDNRIPAGATVKTEHVFDVSGALAAGKAVRLRVVLLYRKYPWDRSRERGWVSNDAVRLVREQSVAP
ncbi:MAG: hypothetical protein KC503_06740 [Myxococcales bacterium]|nr:hypothetical protein [Myxococcales bacterium]